MKPNLDSRIQAYTRTRGAARRLAIRSEVAPSTISRITKQGTEGSSWRTLSRIVGALDQLEAERKATDQGKKKGCSTVKSALRLKRPLPATFGSMQPAKSAPTTEKSSAVAPTGKDSLSVARRAAKPAKPVVKKSLTTESVWSLGKGKGEAVGVEGRLDMVPTFKLPQCRKALATPNLQTTVRLALERRVRRLEAGK